MFNNLPENNNEEKCAYCGASLKKYWHRLTPGLVGTLVKFRSAVVRKNRNSLHVPEEIDLTKSEYNNFQKLRFHALVAKARENGERKTGYWLLTKRGASFLKGEIDVPVAVQTYRNMVVERAEQRVFVKDVIGKTPYFETIDDFEYEIFKPEQVELWQKGTEKENKNYKAEGESTDKALNRVERPTDGRQRGKSGGVKGFSTFTHHEANPSS